MKKKYLLFGLAAASISFGTIATITESTYAIIICGLVSITLLWAGGFYVSENWDKWE